MTLVHEEQELATKYNNKSVAEQNSVDLAWNLLMNPQYDALRVCICQDGAEFQRFRSLVVNSVMATDIMDKQLGQKRKDRWNKAFSEEEGPAEEDERTQINRKATIVIEHLIQASDISHTMQVSIAENRGLLIPSPTNITNSLCDYVHLQHWHIYARWNERLFMEMYKAYRAGRLEKDPSLGWYQGERK